MAGTVQNPQDTLDEFALVHPGQIGAPTQVTVLFGALGLLGAVLGTACAYVVAIGFSRTNQLDGLSALTSIPVANLLSIVVGMPLFAAIAGWVLGGREPPSMSRQPLQ